MPSILRSLLVIALGTCACLVTACEEAKPAKAPARAPSTPTAKKKSVAAKTRPDSMGEAERWKGVVMTGDDSINAFDNARRQISAIWQRRGVAKTDIRELSMTKREQRRGVRASSAKALDEALASLALGPSDGCVVHLTSHGSPWGFYMREQKPLTPFELDRILTRHCGQRPTVLLVSACYSGVFASRILQKPHRVVMTAARDDRTSFGCGVDDKYTFWDGCVIEQLPTATTWRKLHAGVVRCIRAKEREAGVRFSYPQARFGSKVRTLPILSPAREGS